MCVDHRRRSALGRIAEADDALKRDGREPEIFLLLHTRSGPAIEHPRWDRSWATPSEHTIDDLSELGLLRVTPSPNKSRKFSLTMAGRRKAADLLSDDQPGADETQPENARTSTASALGSTRVEDPRKVAVMHGRDLAVVINRFGSWRAAIAAAGRGEIERAEPS